MTDNTVFPVRVKRSRKLGYNMQKASPNGLPVVYVGRGSKWGNPFKVVKYSPGNWAIDTGGDERCAELLMKHGHVYYGTKERAISDAVKLYEIYLFPYEHASGDVCDFFLSTEMMERIQKELAGKNLSCWCGLDSKCHADVLLQVANRITQPLKSI